MELLGIDIGSSSVKCALLRNGKVCSKIVHAKYPSRIDGVRVEVDPGVILKAIQQATRDIGPAARRADCIALSVISTRFCTAGSPARGWSIRPTHHSWVSMRRTI